MAGLELTGFNRKLFADVQSDVTTQLNTSFGSIDLTPGSVFAQLVYPFINSTAELWELAEAVYNSQYPDTAEGSSLDAACFLTGILRLSSTYTTVVCQLTGVNYTTIPVNSEVRVINTSNIFSLNEEITITNEKCYSILLNVISNTESAYNISINSIQVSYTPLVGDNSQTIAAGVVSAVNNTQELGVTATSNGTNVTITTQDIAKIFSCFVSEGISIISCTNNALFIANTKGTISAPSSSVSQIQTPVQGWIAVNNLTAGATGRELETDTQLRARRDSSLRLTGSGTIEAIRARLLNTTGVTAAQITENASSETVSGIPPHSFQALVQGGADTDIAQVIWQAKPAGIRSYGNTQVQVTDSSGNIQLVQFSRSTPVYIFVEVSITKTSSFVDDSMQTIQDNIIKQINSLGSGTDVIYQALFSAVYSVAGISHADITIGSTMDEAVPPVNMQAANIVIEPATTAVTDASKITVSVQ